MNKVDLQTPKPLESILDERRDVWAQLDAAQALSRQTQETLKAISTNGTLTSIELPLAEGTPPPLQIRAIADAIKLELNNRDALQSQITRHRQEIQAIKERVTNTIVGLIIALLAVAAIAYFLVVT